MKVVKKQQNSKMCVICGIENEFGLKAPFYEMEDSSVVSIFEYNDVHQSYPGRVHGGLISTMLDEIIGRAIWVIDPSIWGVTMTLNVKFRKPVPYNSKLKAIGKITKVTSRTFEGEGLIETLDHQVLAQATAVYFKMPLSTISSEEGSHEDVNIYVSDDVSEID